MSNNRRIGLLLFLQLSIELLPCLVRVIEAAPVLRWVHETDADIVSDAPGARIETAHEELDPDRRVELPGGKC